MHPQKNCLTFTVRVPSAEAAALRNAQEEPIADVDPASSGGTSRRRPTCSITSNHPTHWLTGGD